MSHSSEEDEAGSSSGDEQQNLGFNLLFGNLGSDNEVEADWLDEARGFSRDADTTDRTLWWQQLTPLVTTGCSADAEGAWSRCSDAGSSGGYLRPSD